MAGSSKWREPTKTIFDGSDIARFDRSIAKKKIHHTLAAVIEKVKGYEVPSGLLNAEIVTRSKANIPPPERSEHQRLNLPPPKQEKSLPIESKEQVKSSPLVGSSDNYSGILKILDIFNLYIDQTPPLQGPRRFGNLACRDWHDKIIKNAEHLLKENLKFDSGIEVDGLVKELRHYILNSFGSQVRLDYGTGHELSFLAFLGGLFDQKVIKLVELDGSQLLAVFAKYYDLCRRLILLYSLEPAGSHGVWGLDDHFHLIYILGAAQFNGTNKMTAPPISQVLTSHNISAYKLTNLYVNAIAFIYKIKSGPFNEHSPIIYDIHATVVLWSKVLQGLSKMYEVEVLSKYPVVQHFWFGGVLYPWRDFETNAELPVFQKEENGDENNDGIGFINDNKGVKTTRGNISMTGAPWAMNNTARPAPTTRLPPTTRASHTSLPAPTSRLNQHPGTSRQGPINRS